jgi:hypothetical protein
MLQISFLFFVICLNDDVASVHFQEIINLVSFFRNTFANLNIAKGMSKVNVNLVHIDH